MAGTASVVYGLMWLRRRVVGNITELLKSVMFLPAGSDCVREEDAGHRVPGLRPQVAAGAVVGIITELLKSVILLAGGGGRETEDEHSGDRGLRWREQGTGRFYGASEPFGGSMLLRRPAHSPAISSGARARSQSITSSR